MEKKSAPVEGKYVNLKVWGASFSAYGKWRQKVSEMAEECTWVEKNSTYT